MDDIKGIQAVLGEARGGSYEEQLAISHAIRNRGTFAGVYGLNAKLDDVTGEEYQLASKAWYESEEGSDPTFGANHWLSAWDLKHCRPSLIKWRLGMVKTVIVGRFTFYRGNKP